MLVNTERLFPSKQRGKRGGEKKCLVKFLLSSKWVSFKLISVLLYCNWIWKCITSRQQWSKWLACKKQQQKVTKRTGQCLTLSSVRLDLLSCCCFCPSFWAKSLHVGVHSTALTSLLGHELSYLWDMNRTWPRAQITEREEERPWQQRTVAQFSPSSPLLLGGFSAFPALCAAVESSVGLLKLISTHNKGRGLFFLLPGHTRAAGFDFCVCAVLDGEGMWFIMRWSGGLNRRNHSQPHQAIWDHAALRHGCSLHTASL